MSKCRKSIVMSFVKRQENKYLFFSFTSNFADKNLFLSAPDVVPSSENKIETVKTAEKTEKPFQE